MVHFIHSLGAPQRTGSMSDIRPSHALSAGRFEAAVAMNGDDSDGIDTFNGAPMIRPPAPSRHARITRATHSCQTRRAHIPKNNERA